MKVEVGTGLELYQGAIWHANKPQEPYPILPILLYKELGHAFYILFCIKMIICQLVVEECAICPCQLAKETVPI